MKLTTKLLAATAIVGATSAGAVDLEVTHWWTSGGEANAVSKLAEAFDAGTEHTWIDGAIAGGGGTARPIMVSRIIGGDPMGAFQFNHGRQAQELIEEGLLLDLTDVAEANNWKEIIRPSSILDACTLDGRIYCAPLNIHSAQWLWLSNQAYADAGVPVPANWDEFVASAPALEAAGKVPMAMGQQPWQTNLAFGAMTIALAGIEDWSAVNIDRNVDVARGDSYTKVFEAAAAARLLSANSNVQDWNQATNLVITGQAGGQIMGDWAQGEFAVAGQVAGEDYTCLPGLGVNEILDTGGDAFYFPLNDDADITAAQKELAALLVAPKTQVSFNLAKGSLPIRGDVDLDSANDCMRRGLSILDSGAILPSGDMLLSPDTQTQIQDLFVEFWNDTSITAADAQERYAALIEAAD